MKPNYGLIAILLSFSSTSAYASIKDVPIEEYDTRFATAIAGGMTQEASEAIDDLAKAADKSKMPAHLSADNPAWFNCGFQNMEEDDMIAFRRFYGKYGREIALTKDGIVVYPRMSKKELNEAAAKWVKETPSEEIRNVLQFTA